MEHVERMWRAMQGAPLGGGGGSTSTSSTRASSSGSSSGRSSSSCSSDPVTHDGYWHSQDRATAEEEAGQRPASASASCASSSSSSNPRHLGPPSSAAAAAGPQRLSRSLAASDKQASSMASSSSPLSPHASPPPLNPGWESQLSLLLQRLPQQQALNGYSVGQPARRRFGGPSPHGVDAGSALGDSGCDSAAEVEDDGGEDGVGGLAGLTFGEGRRGQRQRQLQQHDLSQSHSRPYCSSPSSPSPSSSSSSLSALLVPRGKDPHKPRALWSCRHPRRHEREWRTSGGGSSSSSSSGSSGNGGRGGINRSGSRRAQEGNMSSSQSDMELSQKQQQGQQRLQQPRRESAQPLWRQQRGEQQLLAQVVAHGGLLDVVQRQKCNEFLQQQQQQQQDTMAQLLLASGSAMNHAGQPWQQPWSQHPLQQAATLAENSFSSSSLAGSSLPAVLPSTEVFTPESLVSLAPTAPLSDSKEDEVGARGVSLGQHTEHLQQQQYQQAVAVVAVRKGAQTDGTIAASPGTAAATGESAAVQTTTIAAAAAAVAAPGVPAAVATEASISTSSSSTGGVNGGSGRGKVKRTSASRNAVAGGLAGAVVSVCIHPMDTVKTIIQSQSGSSRSMLPALVSLVRDRGFLGLYKGLAANLATSAPISAIYTSTYEAVKETLLPHVPSHLTPVAHCVAGACASVATSAVFTPSEVVKQRMQITQQYPNSLAALVGIARTEGPLALYEGLGAVLARNIPNSIIKFLAYETYKGKALQWQNESSVRRWQRAREGGTCGEDGSPPPASTVLSPVAQLLVGGAAGSTAAFCTTPLDVIKTRMQTPVPGREQYKNVADAFFRILREEGVPALYRGVVPRVLIYLSQGAIFFASYEVLRRVLLETSPHVAAVPRPLKLETTDDSKGVLRQQVQRRRQQEEQEPSRDQHVPQGRVLLAPAPR